MATTELSSSDSGVNGNAKCTNVTSISRSGSVLSGMDKSLLKVYLVASGFNVVKCGDATDIKVSQSASWHCVFLYFTTDYLHYTVFLAYYFCCS